MSPLQRVRCDEHDLWVARRYPSFPTVTSPVYWEGDGGHGTFHQRYDAHLALQGSPSANTWLGAGTDAIMLPMSRKDFSFGRDFGFFDLSCSDLCAASCARCALPEPCARPSCASSFDVPVVDFELNSVCAVKCGQNICGEQSALQNGEEPKPKPEVRERSKTRLIPTTMNSEMYIPSSTLSTLGRPVLVTSS